MALVEKKVFNLIRKWNSASMRHSIRLLSSHTIEPGSVDDGVKNQAPEQTTQARWSSFNPNFRFQYPEFLPDPNIKRRNVVREKLERADMMNRRKHIDIPEFYVGSILAVTLSDKHSVEKIKRFVGICIERDGNGLRAWFSLRNVIEHQGVEFRYDVYSPLLQKIEVLRLEKRLDDKLVYLRDAPHEYSTFAFDMEPEYRQPGASVPINLTKVPINPKPWLGRYERMDLQGAILPPLKEIFYKQAKERAQPWVRYDLMDHYRESIPEEEQRDIFNEVKAELEELEKRRKTAKRKRVFVKPEQLRTM